MAAKRKPGAQPGNLNAAKHFIYSKRFKSSANLSDKDLKLAEEGIDHEIALLRKFLLRVAAMADKNPKKGQPDVSPAMLLDLVGTTAIRVGSLLKTKKFLSGEGGGFEAALEQALLEVAAEKGLSK